MAATMAKDEATTAGRPARRFSDARMLALMGEGRTLKETGAALGVSREAVRQRLKRLGLTARSFPRPRSRAHPWASPVEEGSRIGQGSVVARAELLTLNEVARRHGLKPRTLSAAALTGKLAEYGEVVKVGDQWLVTDAAVKAWLEDADHRPGHPPAVTPRREPTEGEDAG